MRFIWKGQMWLLVAALIVLGQCKAFASIKCNNAGDQTICRIDQPVVTQRATPYPVRFVSNDSVVVTAGGCVQTGGHGSTWKLYVNPQGNGSDRLYHGTIWIPSVTSGLVRIASIAGRTLNVPAGLPAAPQSILQLGYEDDDYSDNGYSSHDDGDNNQCENQPDAYVILTITHHATQSALQPADPLDLVTTELDANLLASSPKWAGAGFANGVIVNPLSLCPGTGTKLEGPPCTSQSPAVDDLSSGPHWPGLCSSDYGINGHLNWFAATYEGIINFEDHDDPTLGDDDYNLELVPSKSNAGLLLSNGGSLHLEFDSDETVDHFREAWWQNFHSLVDNNVSAAKELIGNKRAIVSGLVGIDFVHDPATEIHPVYAMAIEVNAATSDDTWAIFVRNFGDEGECSQLQHYLDLVGNIYTFSLPWPPGATGYTIKTQDFQTVASNSVSGPDIQPGLETGVRRLNVSFQLPAPEAESHADGELHIQWLGPVSQMTTAQSLIVRHPMTAEREKGDPEARFAATIRNLDSQQRQTYTALVARTIVSKGLADSVRSPALTLQSFRRVGRPTTRVIRDDRVMGRLEVQRRALCQATGNRSGKLGEIELDCP